MTLGDGLLGVAFDATLLVHAAALCQVAGFMLRDQLKLRALVVVGSLLYISYYFYAPATPLWGAMFWSASMTAVNIVMIVLIARNRSHRALSDDALRMYGSFDAMEPGDFRRLMRLARVSDVGEPMTLTRLDEKAEALFYVIHGPIEIARADRVIAAEGPMFIGEMGYVLNLPASATVTLPPGGRVAAWRTADLRKLAQRHERIGRALLEALNRDLAAKMHAGR